MSLSQDHLINTPSLAQDCLNLIDETLPGLIFQLHWPRFTRARPDNTKTSLWLFCNGTLHSPIEEYEPLLEKVDL